MIIDFKDYRCPNAQLALTRVLASFDIDDKTNELVLLTIEPSLRRALGERIAHMNYLMQLTHESSRELTDGIVMAWGVDVDEDDLSDVDLQHSFTISKNK